MFDVRTLSPIDERWEERDAELILAVGCRSDARGTTTSKDGQHLREHVWYVATLRGALRYKKYLERVDKVLVTIKEHTTEGGAD